MMTLRRLAAVLLSAVLPPVTAQVQQDVLLGRLFSTPSERAALDANRNGGVPPQPNGQPSTPPPQPGPESAPVPPPPSPATTLNGVLRRSSGKSTIWLNDVPLHDTNQLDNQALKLKLTTGRQLILKPGQTYNPNNGAVQEATGQ